MDAHIRIFLETTAINVKKAVVNNDPHLTWAVIKNLASVIDSYEIAARRDIDEIKNPPTRKNPRLREANK